MPPMTTMLIAPSLAPLTGTDLRGCAIRDLARALQQNGWQVTVVVGVSAESNLVGLARRLETLTIGEHDLIVHEGHVEGGGDIRLLAFAGDRVPDAATVLRAATALGETTSVLQVWSETRDALTVSDGLSPRPVVIMHLDGADAGAQTMNSAQLGLLPSSALLSSELRREDSPWKPYASKLRSLAPGVDAREWNPARDSVLAKRMDPPTVASKEEAKAALRSELGLKHIDVPLIGVVTRFDKLPRAAAEELLKMPLQIASVGGGPAIEAMAARAPLKAACPKALSSYEDRQLRHRIVAASDFVLMPSGPAPVSQLFPCRYGAAIIAANRGEFAERISSFDLQSQTGSGFLYKDESELVNAVRRALATYQAGEGPRGALIERCLRLDLSWDTVATRFNELVTPLLQNELLQN